MTSTDVLIKIPTSSELPVSKSLLKRLMAYAKQVDKNNKKFKKLTKTEKRIAIAKDVIAQIKSKRLLPQIGNGFLLPRMTNFENSWADGYTNLQVGTILADRKCEVCALGAMFVSTIDMRDQATCNSLRVPRVDSIRRTQIHEYLDDIFSVSQLTIIERAFEVDKLDFDDESVAGALACEAFGLAIDDASDRLIAIMTNIIENKGQFKP